MAGEKIGGRCPGDNAEAQTWPSRGSCGSLKGKAFVRPIEHHVGGEVIGVRRLHDVIAGDRAHYQVTKMGAQRVADKADNLWKP